MNEPILSVQDLKVHFPQRSPVLRRVTATLRAVDGVSFDLARGTTLGLVGESGCGKSTTARAIVGLLHPTAGRIVFAGETLDADDRRQMQKHRPQIQMVFQDPFATLNPRIKVGAAIREPLEIHGVGDGREDRDRRVAEILTQVGLDPSAMQRFPHEFSGGQRQRIGIARALILRPSLIIADEPVSALDVSVQAQILNLLRDLQRDMGLSYLFISHDLGVVRHMCDEVAVMYLGSIVERGPREALFAAPKHPYTRLLLRSIPVTHPRLRRAGKRTVGEPPNPFARVAGCAFAVRCPRADEHCRTQAPVYETLGARHGVACHHPETGAV